MSRTAGSSSEEVRLAFHPTCVGWTYHANRGARKRKLPAHLEDYVCETSKCGNTPSLPKLTADEVDAVFSSLDLPPVPISSEAWKQFDAMLATLGDDALPEETPASDVAPTGIATSADLPSADVDLALLSDDSIDDIIHKLMDPTWWPEVAIADLLSMLNSATVP